MLGRQRFPLARLLNRHSSVPIPLQVRRIASFRKEYDAHVAERAQEGIPPLALSQTQTKRVCELLTKEKGENAEWLKELLTTRTPAGVDDAARDKAAFLAAVAKGEQHSEVFTKAEATEYLGTMLGGGRLLGFCSRDSSLGGENISRWGGGVA